MTPIVAALAYAVITTALAPLLLTRGRWQVWRPRLALACWHGALATSVAALVFSAVYALALANMHGLQGGGGVTVLLGLGAWAVAFALAVGCALVLGRSEPVVRREQGVKDHLRYAAMRCRQSVETRAGTTIRFVETDAPIAYSFHAPEATVVVSAALRRRLSSRELEAVIAHESAHLHGRHHLALRLANINAACLPGFAPARRLMTSTRFLVELIADDTAAASCGTETAASALTIMAQLTARPELAMRAERLSATHGRVGRIRAKGWLLRTRFSQS